MYLKTTCRENPASAYNYCKIKSFSEKNIYSSWIEQGTSINKKGYFPLAEWNKIGGKCFSQTPLWPGYTVGHVTWKASSFCFVDLPSHPPYMLPMYRET